METFAFVEIIRLVSSLTRSMKRFTTPDLKVILIIQENTLLAFNTYTRGRPRGVLILAQNFLLSAELKVCNKLIHRTLTFVFMPVSTWSSLRKELR